MRAAFTPARHAAGKNRHPARLAKLLGRLSATLAFCSCGLYQDEREEAFQPGLGVTALQKLHISCNTAAVETGGRQVDTPTELWVRRRSLHNTPLSLFFVCLSPLCVRQVEVFQRGRNTMLPKLD